MSDILYICDRKACKRCNPVCHHTTDINHAYNFKKEYLHGDIISFIELPDHKKDVPGDTAMDVFNTLTEKQKNVVYGLIGMIIKKKLPAKLPCICGRKRTSTWTGSDYYIYRCECGFKVKGKTMRELRENWNKAVTEEMEKQLSFDFEEEE